MSEVFKEIKTQEEFDAAISARLKREGEASTKKISELESSLKTATGYKAQFEEANKKLGEANEKLTAAETEKTGLLEKVKGYETNSVKMRIAHETGLPFEFSSRLSGDTEEDIRKDAEGLAKLMGNPKVPPLGTNEPPADGKDAEYKSLLEGLKGDE